jgi:hypothetical protein
MTEELLVLSVQLSCVQTLASIVPKRAMCAVRTPPDAPARVPDAAAQPAAGGQGAAGIWAMASETTTGSGCGALAASGRAQDGNDQSSHSPAMCGTPDAAVQDPVGQAAKRRRRRRRKAKRIPPGLPLHLLGMLLLRSPACNAVATSLAKCPFPVAANHPFPLSAWRMLTASRDTLEPAGTPTGTDAQTGDEPALAADLQPQLASMLVAPSHAGAGLAPGGRVGGCTDTEERKAPRKKKHKTKKKGGRRRGESKVCWAIAVHLTARKHAGRTWLQDAHER